MYHKHKYTGIKGQSGYCPAEMHTKHTVHTSSGYFTVPGHKRKEGAQQRCTLETDSTHRATHGDHSQQPGLKST